LSWCDKLASTPSMGIQLTSDFLPAEQILASLNSILNEHVDEDRGTFDVETIEPFRLIFNTDSGFRYSFDQKSAAITFNHRIRAQAASAGPPIMELISKAAPYTELLNQVKERLARAVALLPNINSRHISRVGIVSVTQVDLEDAPPGIRSLFEVLGKPLGGTVDSFNCAITTVLNKDYNYIDRCIHTFVLPEPPKKMVTVQLDWQRLFNTSQSASAKSTRQVMDAAQGEALAYFEKVAEGGLSDVDSNC